MSKAKTVVQCVLWFAVVGVLTVAFAPAVDELIVPGLLVAGVYVACCEHRGIGTGKGVNHVD